MYRSIILGIAFLCAVSSAAAGSLVSGVCFPTVEQAKQTFCAAFLATGMSTNGASVYTAECVPGNFSLATYVQCRRTNGGACTNSTANFPAFSTCSHTGETTLAAEFFVALLGFLVIVFCAAQMKNHFWHRDNTV